jgi:glucosylceramidase
MSRLHDARPFVHARRRLVGVAAALLAACLAAPAAPVEAMVAQPGGGLVGAPAGPFWATSPTDAARRLLDVQHSIAPATAQVTVDASSPRQTWWGTGAALTDASVELLADRPGILKELYGPSQAQGARLNLLRLPLSATDFSPTTWAWGWSDGRATPTAQARAAADLVRTGVKALRPDVRVIGAPWSAPAALKDTGTLRGGSLSEGQVGSYGKLLVAQATWLKKHGVPLWATSLGNEPGYSSDYPTMTMTDAQMIALGKAVGPRLDRLGTRLWALDHNWSDRARVDTALAGAPGSFDGAAFHCYGGTPSQMAGLAVPRIVTECTGTDGDWAGTFAWDAKNLVVDAVAAGSSGLVMWNLALDEDHGPVDTGSLWGCKTCRGLVTVTPSGMTREPEFYTLAHLSRAADQGARVVTATSSAGLRVAAFRNPDGTVGVFGHNGTGSAQVVELRVPGQPAVSYPVGAGELFSYRQGA